MGCGASSESSQRGDSAGSSGTEAVAVTVKDLQDIMFKYFDEKTTATGRVEAIDQFASKIKGIPADDAEHAVKAAFPSDDKFFMQYAELITEVLRKYEVNSVEYKAAKALLEHSGFNAADAAGCADALPGVFPQTFQGGDYNTKLEICDQIFEGVDKAAKGATAEDIFAKQWENLSDIFTFNDLSLAITAYQEAVAKDANAPTKDTPVAVERAYADMVAELTDAGFSHKKAQLRAVDNPEFAKDYLEMIVAVVKKNETNNQEYKDIEVAFGNGNDAIDLFSSQAGCTSNIASTGFVEVFKGAAQNNAADICAEIFSGTDTFTAKVTEIGDMLGALN